MEGYPFLGGSLLESKGNSNPLETEHSAAVKGSSFASLSTVTAAPDSEAIATFNLLKGT